MKEKNLKIIKGITKIIIVFILSFSNYNVFSQDTLLTFSEFDRFYLKSLEKYKYPQISIPEYAILSEVNSIRFPNIQNKLDKDLIILVHKITEITDIKLYLNHERKKINSDFLKNTKDVANYRLRFIEFLILKKIQSHE